MRKVCVIERKETPTKEVVEVEENEDGEIDFDVAAPITK